MSKQKNATTYQITVQGPLDPEWAEWLHDLTITSAEGDGPPVTTLTGPVVDQVALRGILNKLWDLNLTVLSMNRVDV